MAKIFNEAERSSKTKKRRSSKTRLLSLPFQTEVFQESIELWEEGKHLTERDVVVGGGNLRYRPAVCGAWHRFDCGSGRDGACWELTDAKVE